MKRAALLVGLTALTLLSHSASAAVVTWGAAQDITGDADVSTTGTLVRAFNIAGASTTINGVNFEAFAVGAASNTVGDFTYASTGTLNGGNVSSPNAPFAALSSEYKAMLAPTSANADTTNTLTLGGLTIGQTYLFQGWMNDSRDFGTFGGTFTAGNSVDLETNLTGTHGGLGQYVIGTFVADAATQQIEIFAGEVANFNGFQLRSVGSPQGGGPPAVPLPAALLPGLLLGGAVFARRRA